jgi:hypothetical protein
MSAPVRSRIADCFGAAALTAALTPPTMLLLPFVLGHFGIDVFGRFIELWLDMAIRSFLSLSIAGIVLGGISSAIQRNRAGGIGAIVGSLMVVGIASLWIAATLGAFDGIPEMH